MPSAELSGRRAFEGMVLQLPTHPTAILSASAHHCLHPQRKHSQTPQGRSSTLSLTRAAEAVLHACADVRETCGGAAVFFFSMGETDAIRLLLEYGASLHHETKVGVTPLVAAVREGRLEVRACVM